jgi:hypothetical protein
MEPDVTTFLLRLPIYLHFWQYIDFAILIIFIVFYRSLKNNKLEIIIPLWIGVIVLDLLSTSFAFYIFNIRHIFRLFVVVLAIYIYPSLKRFNLGIFIPLAFIDLTIDVLAYSFSNQGMHNLFLINLSYILLPPIFFIFFYNMLQPKNTFGTFFKVTSFLFICFSLYEYFHNEELRLNSSTIVIFHTLCIILSCCVIGKLVLNESTLIKLTEEPFFWLCAGQILLSIVLAILEGLQPYLVSNFIELYFKYPWIMGIAPFVSIVAAFFNFYALILCAKRYPDRLRFSFSKLFQNKVHHH